MKNVKITLITMLLFFVSIQSIIAQGEVNLIAEFSLFYESYKNKDYESAEPHGWIVIDTDPSQFLKYRPFKKMEDIIVFAHDSVATTQEAKDEYTAKALKLYDKALIAGEKDSSYFTLKKAYIIEEWSAVSIEEKISAYLYALEKFPNADAFYKDRLGTLYANNATEENGYKLKALEIYFKLADEDPENEIWNNKITNLADDLGQLVEYMKKAWDLDRENMEKAWKYAEMCQKAEEFEKAIEPLEFLVKKSPEVVTYQRKLTTLYQKVGRTDDAIKAYKNIIELDPANRDNYYNLAIIYNKLDQLSVARSYLQKATKASTEAWDLPVYMEAQLYEKAASQSGSFEFMDKCVYQLASDTYSQAARIGGSMSSAASDRVQALQNSVPQREDYFFKQIKPGTSIRIEGGSYGWIGRSITSR